MSYITVQEAAKKWGISERLVRRYCAEGRIPDLAQYDGIWQIPEDADKPSRIKKDTVNTPQIPPLLKNLIKQRNGKQYRGLYDYVQINMVYSNGRMASNRLTRNQIELLYKTDRIVTGSEAIKINDIFARWPLTVTSSRWTTPNRKNWRLPSAEQQPTSITSAAALTKLAISMRTM